MIETTTSMYKTIFDKCKEKMEELGLHFDFENNQHLQLAQDMDDLFKDFVFHSQNRSQGYAINFLKCEAGTEAERSKALEVWREIENYEFNLNDKFSYIGLFNKFKELPSLADAFNLSDGKDILYLGLAKTCQCIKNYLNNYDDIEAFKMDHIFTEDKNNNWRILNNVSDNIYNMGTALVPDFFKEQGIIEGREFLMKSDVHVNRFFTALNNCSNELSDRKVYNFILDCYKKSNWSEKINHKPYQIDKYIYFIGVKLVSPSEMIKFAKSVRELLVE